MADENEETSDPGLLDRLRQVIGANVSEFARVNGLNSGTVQTYLRGRLPSYEFLATVHRNLDVNINWLVTGEGQMYVSHVRKFTDDPDLVDLVEWADEFPEVKGMLLYIVEKEVRPFYERHKNTWRDRKDAESRHWRERDDAQDGSVAAELKRNAG